MKTFPDIRQAVFAIVLLLAATGTASAQSIYKCTHGGRLEYTDHPCPGGTGELIHKADDGEIIDQYLDLGQDDLAKRYAQSRHLDALYQNRLDAYQQRMAERAQREAADAQQRDEQAQQQALADEAARREQSRERLQVENDALRQQNDQYRDQLAQPDPGYAPNYWAPPYWNHDHDHGQHPMPPPAPVFHPCRQLAGGRVQC